MILKVFMQLLGKNGMTIRHSIQDMQGGEIAVGTTEDSGAFVTLEYKGKFYRYVKKPVKIEKSVLRFPLPAAGKGKTTFGHQITCAGETVMKVYTQPLECGKMWIFKRNIGVSVYQYQGKSYHVSKIGFPGEISHYYCLRSAEGETLATIERYSFVDDTNRATIYLKDPAVQDLAILVCANEIMMVYFSVGEQELRDESAGHYISLTDAEKSLYDKNFIPAVKAMHGIYD